MDDIVQIAFVFTKLKFDNNVDVMPWADGIDNVYFIWYQEETTVHNGHWQHILVPMASPLSCLPN